MSSSKPLHQVASFSSSYLSMASYQRKHVWIELTQTPGSYPAPYSTKTESRKPQINTSSVERIGTGSSHNLLRGNTATTVSKSATTGAVGTKTENLDLVEIGSWEFVIHYITERVASPEALSPAVEIDDFDWDRPLTPAPMSEGVSPFQSMLLDHMEGAEHYFGKHPKPAASPEQSIILAKFDAVCKFLSNDPQEYPRPSIQSGLFADSIFRSLPDIRHRHRSELTPVLDKLVQSCPLLSEAKG